MVFIPQFGAPTVSWFHESPIKMMELYGHGRIILVPIIENGSTLLPIRSLIKNMGGTVDWFVKDK